MVISPELPCMEKRDFHRFSNYSEGKLQCRKIFKFVIMFQLYMLNNSLKIWIGHIFRFIENIKFCQNLTS